MDNHIYNLEYMYIYISIVRLGNHEDPSSELRTQDGHPLFPLGIFSSTNGG